MASLFHRLIVVFVSLLPRVLVYPFARRYIAGPRLEDAIRVTQALNARGIMVTIDVLGEHVHRIDDAREAVDAYRKTLQAIVDLGLDANISLKPTQFGLAIDPETAEKNIREVVALAHELGIFVRIDMEDSPYTDATLNLYERLRETYPRVGTVIQSRLRRSHTDVSERLRKGANLRVVKGIYLEPYPIAFQDPEVITRNFVDLLETHLQRGGYAAVATHDEVIVWEATRLFRRYDVPGDRYEFQVLLGVREELRDQLVKDGHRVRVYVPYGRDWHAYAIRRLKENPDIAGHIVHSMFDRVLGR